MDREEILAKSRLENRRWDERERRMADEAGTWGVIAMAAAVVSVFLIRMFLRVGIRTICSLSYLCILLLRVPINGARASRDGRFW